MYLIKRKKLKGKYKDELILNGFMMGAKGKVFTIKSYKVKNIIIYSVIIQTHR